VSLSTPGQQYIPNASPSVAWDFLQWYEFYIYQLDYYLYLDIFINMEISQNGGKTFVITRNLFNAAAPYEQTRNVLRLTDNLLYKDLWQKIVFLQTWYIYLFRVSSPRDVPDDLKTQFRLTYDYNDKRSAYNKGRVIYTFPSSVFYHLTSTEIRVDYGDSSNHYRLSAQNFADFMKEWWKDEPGSTAYKAFSAIADHQSYYGRMPILPLIDRRWTQGG
jgi:hypothetical protein